MNRPRFRTAILLAATFAALLPAGAAAPALASSDPGPAYGLRGIPSGAPPAAYRAEPSLPAPAAWPFSEAFPRTSGTGRLAGGATFWSDFLYDDRGAELSGGFPAESGVTLLAPPNGNSVYPAGPALMNGADVFRAAAGLTRDATIWRVDWTTLADATVPIAVWTFDTDSNTSTGGSAWPAAAGVRSAGFERALVVSSRGARLLDGTGRELGRLRVTVDSRARSFLVRVPRSLLPVSGSWTVRLAAGLADPAGTGFAVPQTNVPVPAESRVYNVTFRSRQQEPPVYKPSGEEGALVGVGLGRGVKYGNFWMEDHQAEALAAGDVSPFALQIDWRALAARTTTPEPRPTGYSNRWYVSELDLGQGVVEDEGTGSGDLRPNFLGRVQPYAVYVPTTYEASSAAPLTWVLHSLSVQHNQYGALDPAMLQQLCEDRRSICATTLGYGPDGWYFDEAELDFFRVWNALARTYTLDPERTVISGYSMGGFGTYHLGLKYPQLFAKGMPLAGPPGCGLRFTQEVGEGAGGGSCDAGGNTTAMLRNARWIPFVIGHGVFDQLVPVSSVLEQVQELDRLGYRHHFELYPLEDHLVYATQDGFSTLIEQIGTTPRVRNPGRIDFAWFPADTRPDLGTGVSQAYWLRDLRARDAAPGVLATVTATSGGRPDPAVTAQRSRSVTVPGDPSPALVQRLTWSEGARPAPKAELTLALTNVSSLAVDLARAGLSGGRVSVETDGATLVRLLGLRPGTKLMRGTRTLAVAGGSGSLQVKLPAGLVTLVLAR